MELAKELITKLEGRCEKALTSNSWLMASNDKEVMHSLCKNQQAKLLILTKICGVDLIAYDEVSHHFFVWGPNHCSVQQAIQTLKECLKSRCPPAAASASFQKQRSGYDATYLCDYQNQKPPSYNWTYLESSASSCSSPTGASPTGASSSGSSPTEKSVTSRVSSPKLSAGSAPDSERNLFGAVFHDSDSVHVWIDDDEYHVSEFA
jgi:hypothetical protein